MVRIREGRQRRDGRVVVVERKVGVGVGGRVEKA